MPERFNSPEAFGEIVVRTQSDGSQIKLKDVATINLGVETYNVIPRLNGKTAAIVALYQAPGSNAVELAQQVVTQMDELAKNFPESVTYDVSLDSTAPIPAGIRDIIVTLFIALALVILVVFIFIQDWRAPAQAHRSVGP